MKVSILGFIENDGTLSEVTKESVMSSFEKIEDVEL